MKSSSRVKPVEDFIIHRRNLPHWELTDSVYFITFRTTAGYILSDEAKDIVLASIKFHANKKYRLYACVVLDTHVHLVIQPKEESEGAYFSLSQIMHSIKSYSAHRIVKTLGKTGNIWLDESYDRIVRDDNEFLEKLNYIINNPVKAGIASKSEEYKWLCYEGQFNVRTGEDARATDVSTGRCLCHRNIIRFSQE